MALKRTVFAPPAPPDVTSALGKLYAGLTARTTTPCRVAFAGSSTTAGSNASTATNRYVNRLVAALQEAYPSGLGSESSVIASTSATWGTPSTAAGVHGYNAGQGGATSATYLTSGEITSIAALNPAAVFHMIGSNDFSSGVPVATYKANVQAVIADLKAAMTAPCVHVLVQPYERFDVFTPAAPWADYGTALTEIAAADPDNVAFVDISRPYRVLGIPGADPLNLLDTDSVHQTDAGHAFMADLLARALGIPASRPQAVTASRTLARFTSDLPSAADATNLVGVATDALMGGSSKTWVGDANALAISSGTIVRGASSATFFAGLLEPVPDTEFSVVINTLPVGGPLYLDLHRQAGVGAGVPDTYRVSIATNGTIALIKRIASASSTFVGGIPYAAGDRISVRYYRGALSLRRNGTLVASATDTAIPSKGWSGFAGFTDVTGLSVSGVTLDVVT